jgi:hypothetical protein
VDGAPTIVIVESLLEMYGKGLPTDGQKTQLFQSTVRADHLRATDKALAALLDTGMVLAHPFVTGELALGNLRQREIVLNALADLPMPASRQTRRFFISSTAMGCSDAGSDISTPICSPRRTDGRCGVWTNDKRLRGVAVKLGLAFTPRQHRGS